MSATQSVSILPITNGVQNSYPPRMNLQQAGLTICGAAAAYFWYKRYHTSPISDISGPENPSWIFGHRWWWAYDEAIVFEKRLLEKYGAVVRWNGLFGEERLWVCDPKVIQHILQGSGYLYEKSRAASERLATVMDWGLVSVDGDLHKRQRRAMAPAFGLVEAKALYPYFVRCSGSLADKWHEALSNAGPGRTAIIDVNPGLSKGTLDAIGAGAFEYDFGAIEDTDNEFTRSFTNLSFGAFGQPSKKSLFLLDALEWLPNGFGTWLNNADNSPGMVRVRENRKHTHEAAVKLIEQKRQELKDGTSRKDVLSLLVKANSSLRPDWRLKDEEIVPQVRTILFAGHVTVARALTFGLWELAQKLDVQERLRKEIMETLAQIRDRGGSDFTVNDFDSMPYLLAVVKEILRVYPPATEISRVPKKDDVLPLSRPVVGISGKVYDELHVPAGTSVTISTIAYNLNKDLWGPDAYEFRPERWLDMNEKPETPVGVYSNLATFSGGPKSCIGWRFAVIEMHTFLVTLIRKFHFSLPNNGQEMRKMRTTGIIPAVIGEEHKGPQMPLRVSTLENE